LWNNLSVTHVLLAVFLASAYSAAPLVDVPAAAPESGQFRQQGQGTPSDPKAEAYYQFLNARRLESAGDAEGALKAYRKALELDPASAEIYADIATLHARQGRLDEARIAAEAGLKNDPDNGECHRILGMLAADGARSDDDQAASSPEAQTAAKLAIGHLEKALKSASLDEAAGIRLALGRLCIQTRQLDQAVAVLKKVVVDEPGMAEGIALLGQAYTLGGRTSEAVALLEDAARHDPGFYATLAETYEKSERWAEAAMAYGKAVESRPRDIDLKTHWALTLLNMEDKASALQARALLLDVTAAKPTTGWPLYLLARAQRATGDIDGAEHTARRLLALSPISVSGAHALAQALVMRRDFAGVIAALGPMVDKMPKGREADQALVLSHLGVAYLETNRLAESVAAFTRARALNPNDAAILVYLGQALVTNRQFSDALALVRPRREAGDTDTRLARIEADALRGLGKVAAGAAVLQAIVDGPKVSSEAYRSLGEYYAAAHEYGEATEVLTRARKKYPEDLDVLFQYGAMLERERHIPEAERVMRDVLARDARHAPALNYLGYMLTERGDRFQEALELIGRAVGLDPYNGAYLDSLGWVYLKLGRLDEAEPRLRDAATQLPRDSVVQDHWGDLLAKRGRFADAVAAWKQALAGDGESIDRAAIERKIKNASGRNPRP
jgi:tetratricopeptide (TPR) repeat protein